MSLGPLSTTVIWFGVRSAIEPQPNNKVGRLCSLVLPMGTLSSCCRSTSGYVWERHDGVSAGPRCFCGHVILICLPDNRSPMQGHQGLLRNIVCVCVCVCVCVYVWPALLSSYFVLLFGPFPIVSLL